MESKKYFKGIFIFLALILSNNPASAIILEGVYPDLLRERQQRAKALGGKIKKSSTELKDKTQSAAKDLKDKTKKNLDQSVKSTTRAFKDDIDSLFLNPTQQQKKITVSLRKAGITKITQLMNLSKEELIKIPKIGSSSVKAIEEELRDPYLNNKLVAALSNTIYGTAAAAQTLKDGAVTAKEKAIGSTKALGGKIKKSSVELKDKTQSAAKDLKDKTKKNLDQSVKSTTRAFKDDIDSLFLNPTQQQKKITVSLRKAGITKITQLMNLSKEELIKIPKIGSSSVKAIEEELRDPYLNNKLVAALSNTIYGTAAAAQTLKDGAVTAKEKAIGSTKALGGKIKKSSVELKDKTQSAAKDLKDKTKKNLDQSIKSTTRAFKDDIDSLFLNPTQQQKKITVSLRKAGITKITQLMNLSKEELIKIPKIGSSSVKAIEEELRDPYLNNKLVAALSNTIYGTAAAAQTLKDGAVTAKEKAIGSTKALGGKIKKSSVELKDKTQSAAKDLKDKTKKNLDQSVKSTTRAFKDDIDSLFLNPTQQQKKITVSLRKAGITKITQLMNLSKEELIKIPKIGSSSVKAIEKAVHLESSHPVKNVLSKCAGIFRSLKKPFVKK